MAHYYFTRQAFLDLEDIHQFSVKHWGERVAQAYMEELYKSFQEIADQPGKGKLRRHRSYPYFMAPAGKHFAVYEPLESGIVIATVIHSKRDIETLVRMWGPELAAEIKQLRQRLSANSK